MASANVSYINTYPAPDWPRIRTAVYNWSLLGFGLLDVILLFWLLNPLAAQPAHHYRLVMNQSQAPVSDQGAIADKPSPLGSIVVRTHGHRSAEPVK
jgi:hypothetical protein